MLWIWEGPVVLEGTVSKHWFLKKLNQHKPIPDYTRAAGIDYFSNQVFY